MPVIIKDKFVKKSDDGCTANWIIGERDNDDPRSWKRVWCKFVEDARDILSAESFATKALDYPPSEREIETQKRKQFFFVEPYQA
jgi:hypothetical protein